VHYDEEEKMRAEWILVLLAFAAGTALPVQFAVNSELRGAVGGPVTAAALSFLVGTFALAAAVLVARQEVPTLSGASQAPWWAWTGGLLGAFLVAASIILTPKLGAATTITLVIAGQIFTSIVLDHFGLLNLPVHVVTLPRIGGAVLVIVGAVLVLRS
jgi:transporter family-2 protein